MKQACAPVSRLFEGVHCVLGPGRGAAGGAGGGTHARTRRHPSHSKVFSQNYSQTSPNVGEKISERFFELKNWKNTPRERIFCVMLRQEIFQRLFPVGKEREIKLRKKSEEPEYEKCVVCATSRGSLLWRLGGVSKYTIANRVSTPTAEILRSVGKDGGKQYLWQASSSRSCRGPRVHPPGTKI